MPTIGFNNSHKIIVFIKKGRPKDRPCNLYYRVSQHKRWQPAPKGAGCQRDSYNI